jgi:peroxiredoxin
VTAVQSPAASFLAIARPDDFHTLPPDLPVPEDDGAADHLPGMELPPLALRSTEGGDVVLAELAGRSVLFFYPRTGVPGHEMPPGWDEIPGARGCTPEACGFRDRHELFADAGARVLALSTQDPEYQRELAERIHLPFPVLSDERLELVRALRLPTFEAGGSTLVKRLTLVTCDGRIEHVFYPVFPPDAHAGEVLEWLRG